MISSKTTPNSDVTAMSTDLSSVDIDRAMQRGRRLRAEAFSSVLKSLFSSKPTERTEQKRGFTPDCTAAA